MKETNDNAIADLAALLDMIAKHFPDVTTKVYDTREFGERAKRVYATLAAAPPSVGGASRSVKATKNKE